jgi:predicted Zn finger-like uncharacterized protein
MIITCASCLTKFNLDDSRIQAKGIKVRCSRCKHLFYVVPPPETRQEMIENAESFAKYHEDLMEPGERKAGTPPGARVREEEAVPEEQEAVPEEQEAVPEEQEETGFPFSERAPEEKAERWAPLSEGEESAPPERAEELPPEEPKRVKRGEGKSSRPKGMLQAEKKGPFRFLPLLIVLVLLVFGIFYVWSELSMGGRLSSSLEYPVKKMTELWNQVWGVEKEDLNVGDLSRYDEQVEDFTLFIIEGKVKNQSKSAKKYIKVRIVIFDEDKLKVAEQDAICGRVVGREELKKQPPEFFKGDMMIKPETEQEMITPPGKATPFMVIFKDLPSRAKDFKYEILEAPNL